MLSHDNKDYEVWLKSKGSLSMEHQQYRHWIQASQFSPAHYQYVEVKGYEQKGSQYSYRAGQSESRTQLMKQGTHSRLTREGESETTSPEGRDAWWW